MGPSLVQNMELAGIEPASEDSSTTVSSITVRIHSFPQQTAYERADCFSSFISLRLPQSLGNRVPRMDEAGKLKLRETQGRLPPLGS